MKQLTLTFDDATFDSADRNARKAGQSLTALLMDFVRRFSSPDEADFQRLVREEEMLRERLQARGTGFSAADRLTRDELHDRHALR